MRWLRWYIRFGWCPYQVWCVYDTLREMAHLDVIDWRDARDAVIPYPITGPSWTHNGHYPW